MAICSDKIFPRNQQRHFVVKYSFTETYILKRTPMLVTEQASGKNWDSELTVICQSSKEFT